MKSSASRTFFFLLFAFAGMQLSAQQGETRVITLVCDSNQLPQSGPAENACYFQGGQDVNPKEFLSYANVGDEIIWEAYDSTEQFTIVVTRILHLGGTNIFDAGEVPGRGRAQRRTDRDYRYAIHFTLEGTTRNFHIDPKIQVR